MSKLREAAQQVVNEHEAGFVGLSLDKAVAALKAALAEPVQEPVQEPTKAMIDAAERIDWSDADVRGNIINMWQAMIAASSQSAQQQEPVQDHLPDATKMVREPASDFERGFQRGWQRAMRDRDRDALVRAKVEAELAATVERLAEPVQEPVAWTPIEQPYPQGRQLDILMGDGSILCAVFPQADGDLWWRGSYTEEKFIDPNYANVTHWRIHSDTRPAAPAADGKGD